MGAMAMNVPDDDVKRRAAELARRVLNTPKPVASNREARHGEKREGGEPKPAAPGRKKITSASDQA
jgi:hypothetical protein